MIDPIVHSESPVTLVGAGDATPECLQKALTLAPLCVAADGGAALVLATGTPLAAVIGDFDSIDDAVLAQIPTDRRHRIAEQTTTDFEKALTRISAPLVLGLGFLGGRLDHQMAAFHTLLAYPERPCVLIGNREIVCLVPPQITLPTVRGDIVSLFPMGPVTGESDGLAWPIEGLDFSPFHRIGTSNRAEGEISLRIKTPGMLAILPRRIMPALVAQLLGPDALRWPARAG